MVCTGPALDQEQPLDAADVALLGAVSPSDWTDAAELARMHAPATIERLLAKGLLVADDAGAHAVADRSARARHWRPLSAVAHRHSRWRGVDTEVENERLAGISGGAVLDHLGPPPPPVLECVAATQRIALPRAAASALDALLDRRVTCRNFDTARALTLAEVGAVLYRAFGARTEVEITGVPVLKRGVPSAGGLHPTEAYLLVRRVEGLAPGLYHYHPIAHALEPLRELTADEAAEHARRFVAGQAWFTDAPLQLVMASRFERNFWKYRSHAKAWRATILDAGHLSQTVYLAATELGRAVVHHRSDQRGRHRGRVRARSNGTRRRRGRRLRPARRRAPRDRVRSAPCGLAGGLRPANVGRCEELPRRAP